MSASADDERAIRGIAGKPRVRAAIVWFAIGVAWLVLAGIEGPTAMRITVGVIELAVGVVYGMVAFYDLRHHRGAYTRG